IEGKPASGKTTLMRRLAYEWAKGSEGLSNFDLIFYAEFREVRQHEFESIADLIFEYNKSFFESGELENQQSLLFNREFSKRKRIFVLLDGYDESSLDKQCKELKEYLTSDTIRKELVFNVVLTARPGYLGQHRGKEGRFVFAEVLGFTTKKQKEKYISN